MLPAAFAVIALISTFKLWLPHRVEFFSAERKSYILYMIAVVSVFLWLIYLFPILMSSSFTPDESLFIYQVILRNNDQGTDGYFWWVGRYISQANLFGYGGLWNGIYSLIIDFSSALHPPSFSPSTAFPGDRDFRMEFLSIIDTGNEYLRLSMWLMRSLAISVAAIFMLRVSRRILKEPLAVLGVALLLTMPMMYWSGKIASPEYFGAFLLLISAFEYFEGRNQKWLFLSGIACSIKLTCAPVAAMLLICALPFEWRRGGVKSCFGMGVKFAAGLLIANLYLLAHPIEFVNNLLHYSSLFSAAPWELSFMVDPLPFWEGGTYGNLSYWFGSLFGFLSVLVISFFANPRLGLFLALSAVSMFVFMLTQPLHNWYWFPVLLCSVIPLSLASARGLIARPLLAVAFLAVICINLYFSVGSIRFEVNNRIAHVAEYESFKKVELCVETEINKSRSSTIYDMAMIGKVIPLMSDKLYESYPVSFSLLSGMPDIQGDKSRMAVIGPRAAAVAPIATFIEKAVTAGAEHGLCGKTLWVRF